MVIRNKEFYEKMNRIIEKLAKSNLSGTDLKYCLVIFRKTFGFGKYEDRISRSQIAEMTNMAEVSVSRTGSKLKKRRILIKKGKIKGFNLNTNTWEKVTMLLPFEKVTGLLPKGNNQAEKKGNNAVTYKETTKKLTKEGGVVLKRLGIKEVEKLEGKKWLRQVMWQRYSFKKEFIDRILKEYGFTKCYDAYLAFEEAKNVFDKKAWILARLERDPDLE